MSTPPSYATPRGQLRSAPSRLPLIDFTPSWSPATLLQSSTVQAQVSVPVETLVLELVLRLAVAAFHP